MANQTSPINMMEASCEWASRPADQRFQSLADLTAAVKSRRLRSRSHDLDVAKIEAKESDGKLVINGTITPCAPSHWSFGQLASTVGAPASYLRTLPLPILTQALNYGIKNHPIRDTLKFMTVADADGGDTNQLQAVTSATYGRIWDADVCDCVGRLVERTGGKFHNPLAYGRGEFSGQKVPSGLYASDRDCFIFMIDGGSRLEAGPRAQLHRGFIVKNSEVGSAVFSLTTFLFNEVCGNHIIWGAQEINKLSIRHTQNGPARFDGEAAPGLLAYATAPAKPVEDSIRKAQSFLIDGAPNFDDVVTFSNRHSKFSRAEVRGAVDFAKAEEGDCRTLWHLVQGFTAYARGLDFIDARVDLETRAGRLLDLAKVESAPVIAI